MKIKEHSEAKTLRKAGFSIKEIATKLHVSKSTASLWARDIALSETAKRRIMKKIEAGRVLSAERKKEQTERNLLEYAVDAQKLIKKNRYVLQQQEISKILCAILYWCEGYKNIHGGLAFSNSDPNVIAIFLKLLRASFPLDEKRLRACIHLHPYHSETKQKKFWSHITGIPKRQFIKSYQKLNGGKNLRKDYPGCLSVRYHDSFVGREVMSIGKAFLMGV